jgi:hypothetical protein
MLAKAKKITLYLENGTLDGLINISESDGWDFGGELYSCPRNKLDELINDESADKVGVYMLLSNKQVYVGQATDLRSRIKQHKLSKDWWERVILLTSKKDELNQSHITYLEAALIQKATDCGTNDIENKTKGNKHNLDKYDTRLLDQYLEEAYFILELIGVTAFQKNKRAKSNTNTILPPVENKTTDQIELRAKKEVEDYLKENNVELFKFFSYAKLQEKKKVFWINPDRDLIKNDWMLVLNNQVDRFIHILKVPGNTFLYSLNNEKGVLRIRSDKPMYLDLHIDAKNFVDTGSKASFKEFVIKSIKY